MYVVVFTGETDIVCWPTLPGFHVYDVAPVAVRLAAPPLQSEVSFEAVICGAEVTCTVTESIAVQPKLFVAVTVYVVVTAGLAVGLDVFAPVSDPLGSQLYVCPFGPEATITVVLPVQMLVDGLTATVATEIFMLTISESEHPLASVM